MTLVTPQQKQVDIIDYGLQHGDVGERIGLIQQISNDVINQNHDSSAYHFFLGRHTAPIYEPDASVRAIAFDAIEGILTHELKHNIRPNPHLFYIDSINDALKNEREQDTLEAALYCYAALSVKQEYTQKITKGVKEIERGLNDLLNNKAATTTLKYRAEESRYFFERHSGMSTQFNDVRINFGIAENLDPQEKNNMTLFTEIQEFRKRTEQAAQTSLGTLRLMGEFDNKTAMIDVPKDALDQIELDMLNYRSTKFEDVSVLKNGTIIAQGCQPS